MMENTDEKPQEKHFLAPLEEPKPKSVILRYFKVINRRFHLDKNIWNFILILLVLLSVVNVCKRSNITTTEGQQNILSAAGIISAAGALLWTANGIHNQYHDNLLTKASSYVTAWYGSEMSESIRIARSISKEEFCSIYNGNSLELDNKNIVPILTIKYGKDGSLDKLTAAQTKIAQKILSDERKQEAIGRVLDFFEQMSQDIKFGVIDSEYTKDFFYVVVIQYYELLRKYIEYMQKSYHSHFLACNFVYLAQTWEKEGWAPKVPEICMRESILTPEDIEAIGRSAESSDRP